MHGNTSSALFVGSDYKSCSFYTTQKMFYLRRDASWGDFFRAATRARACDSLQLGPVTFGTIAPIPCSLETVDVGVFKYQGP